MRAHVGTRNLDLGRWAAEEEHGGYVEALSLGESLLKHFHFHHEAHFVEVYLRMQQSREGL